MVGRSILIVVDEAPIREMIAVALEMAGYDAEASEFIRFNKGKVRQAGQVQQASIRC